MVVESPAWAAASFTRLTKDWQVAPIVSLYTGQPFTVTTGSDVSLTGENLDRPNVVPGVANRVPHTLAQWFNPALFAGGCNNAAYASNPYCVPLGTFGNAGRDHLPRSGHDSVGHVRQPHVPVQGTLEARVQVGVLQHHEPRQLERPAAGLTSSTYSWVTAFGGPRLIQMSLKLTF